MVRMQLSWRGYRRGRLNPLQAGILRLVLLAGAASMIVPFAWMVSTALKDNRTLQREPSRWLPKVPVYVTKGDLGVDWLYATTEDFRDVVLADFEQAVDGLPVAPEAARVGRRGLLLRYDFASESAQEVSVTVPVRLGNADLGRATLIALWVHGDGSGHKLHIRVTGKGFAYRSVEPLGIDFDGWKEVYCFLRPEQFDPLGRAIVQMRRDDGTAGPAPLAAIESIELTIVRTSRFGQIWARWTDSFRKAWTSMPFGRFYLNSLFVALVVTIGQVTTSAMAAYAFARLQFPGRDKLFFAYLGTMMIPAAVMIVPTFILMRLLGWFDTYKALILPGMFSAYGTFMLRQFFKTLPRDLEDAARIDGCGKLRVWIHVILPLSKPALATLATFTFLASWQAFQWPLFATKSMHMRVLPIGLSAFQDRFNVQYNLLMAAALIVMIPTLLVFIFNQRFFTKGIVLSGMKE